MKPITVRQDGQDYLFESEKSARDAFGLTDYQLQKMKKGFSWNGVTIVSTEVLEPVFVLGLFYESVVADKRVLLLRSPALQEMIADMLTSP